LCYFDSQQSEEAELHNRRYIKASDFWSTFIERDINRFEGHLYIKHKKGWEK